MLLPARPFFARAWPVLLLLLALVSFGACWLAYTYGQPSGDHPAYPNAVRLQSLVTQAATTAGREASRVAQASQPPKSLRFSYLLAQCSYPTFVARYGQVVGWSASGPQPTAAELANPTPERLAQTALGEFLVVRRALGAVVVLTYVPLARHYGISNRYLREGAEPALLQGLQVQVQAAGPRPGEARGPRATVVDTQGRYLFSVVPLPGSVVAGRLLPLLLLLLGIAGYTAGWLTLAARWWQQGRVGRALLALAGTPLALRAALLYLSLPYAWLELPLFDPRVYAVSGLAPSLGDLLLNGVLALLLAGAAVVANQHYRLPLRAQQAPAGRWGIPALLGFMATVVSLYSYYTSAFSNNQLSLDITQSMQVSGFRLVLVLAVLLHTAAFVTAGYLCTGLLAPDLRRRPRRPLLAGGLMLAATLLGLGAVLHQVLLLLPGMACLYLTLVRLGELHHRPAQGPPRYLLLLLLLSLVSAVGATALYGQFERQLLLDKQRLAGNLLVDNDLQGEFLLGQRLRQLAADPVIARLLLGTPVRTEALRRRIERQYLRTYFDKYEESVDLFDPQGQPVGGEPDDSLTFNQTRAELSRTATATDQPGVYLLKSGNSFSSRRYVAVVPVTLPAPGGRRGRATPAGTILLTLSLKQLASYSVLPELLVDQKFFQPGLATDLSYAGYAQGQLVYSEGDFDYANLLSPALLRDPQIYADGLVISDFHHLATHDASGDRIVVVTTATYSLADWFSNFSFQLLLNVLVWLLAGGAYLLGRRGGWGVRFNFSARIQLLLNLGILIPLLVVSVATASQVISGYRRDLRRTYERRGHIALESLLRRREQLSDTTARPVLTALARNVAALTETDLNLYDARGQLLVSSQPLIFEAGLLGTLLNPQALIDLRERGLSRTLLTERAGTLSFSSLYLPVRAASVDGPAGPVLGYVGIPFFDSQKELDNKLTELFTTILNVFTLMFLVFLGLAFLATRQLTAPLKLLTQRLKRTTLTGRNEVLDYRSSDDEIGLLVSEYNAMLGKLEASKRELAAQEKEAAWREMARQVAHEIKNPLTPMKLSLQYLQKAIAERRPNAEALIGRISQTLITQIDVLADIATSFSTFTNLPTMRPDRLDVTAVLRQCAHLFREQDGDGPGKLDLALPPDGTYTVFADESLLVRTFNNLLLNAKQAVPPGRAPSQRVALRPEGPGHVLITITDNGAGIPEEARENIFRPNFTTKATGSGIGLAVAKRGIESAGGRIWFETEAGVGTTFFIELPLAG